MCNQPPPPVPAPLDIDGNATDEDIVQFLGTRAAGDPPPPNVITEVNPLTLDPRTTAEGVWYLFPSRGLQPHNEEGTIEVTNGYWNSTDNHRILTSTLVVGRKRTREFYTGQAPFGVKTCWRMHEYSAEQVASEGNNKINDDNALCRFFLQTGERINAGQQYDPLSCDANDMEGWLLSLMEQEEICPSLTGAADGAEVVCDDAPAKLESSSQSKKDAGNDNSMEGIETGYDFSKEDYLELKDLYDPESSSTSSDNSSLMSMNSDECFDAEALLRDVENEDLSTEEGRLDHRVSITSSARPDHVVIQQPPPAFSNSYNLVVSDSRPRSSIPAVNIGSTSSAVEPQSDSDASMSGTSQGSRGGASHSGSSQGGTSSSSQRSRSKSIRRMAKLGKRYFCFRGSS